MTVDAVLQQLSGALAGAAPPARAQYLPSISELGRMYAAGVISAAEWGAAMDLRGVPEIWKTPYLQMVVASTSTEVRAMMSSVALGRYKSGWTDSDTLRSELGLLGYQGDELERLIYVAGLDKDTADRTELRDTYKEAFMKSVITEAEADQQLATLYPLAADRDQVLQQWRLLKTPKPTVPKIPEEIPLYRTEEGKTRVDALKISYRNGRISPSDLLTGLQDLAMAPGLAQAVLDEETARKLGPVPAPVAAPPRYLTDAGRLRVQTVRDLYRQAKYSEAEARASLNADQMPADLIDAVIVYELARRPAPTPAEAAPPIPLYQTAAGKSWYQTLLTMYDSGSMLPEELYRSLRLDLGWPDAQAITIVRARARKRGWPWTVPELPI